MSGTHYASSKSFFLTLPREIRDIIYNFVFSLTALPDNPASPGQTFYSGFKFAADTSVAKPPSDYIRDRVHFPEVREQWQRGHLRDLQELGEYIHTLPMLCLVSRRVYLESVPVYLKDCVLNLRTPTLRKVTFEWLSRFQDSSAFLAFRSMTIYIEIDAVTLDVEFFKRCQSLRHLEITWIVGRSTNNLEHLVESRQIAEIVNLPRLDKIAFTLRRIAKLAHGGTNLTNELYDWFVKTWKERGRKVVVEKKRL